MTPAVMSTIVGVVIALYLVQHGHCCGNWLLETLLHPREIYFVGVYDPDFMAGHKIGKNSLETQFRIQGRDWEDGSLGEVLVNQA